MMTISTLLSVLVFSVVHSSWMHCSLILGVGMLPVYFFLFFLNTPCFNMGGVSSSFSLLADLDVMGWSLSALTLYVLFMMGIVSMKLKSKNFSVLIYSSFFIFFFVFSTSQLLSFYILFELTMIPVTIMIAGWGYQPERMKAMYYLVVYTVFSSLPLLYMIIKWSSLYSYGHFSQVASFCLEPSAVSIMTLRLTLVPVLLNVAFLVKAPMALLHIWLPNAHVQAPVEGSMILAGVMLKLGGYGMLRLSPVISFSEFFNSVIYLSIIVSSTFMCFLCLREPDVKVLIAISSVVHMSLMILGAYLQTPMAVMGMFFIMLAHGFCSPGLFLGAYLLYLRTHSRNILLMSPASSFLPYFSFIWFLLCLANMSAPPTLNLVGELMCFMSITSISYKYALFLGVMVFLSGAYTLVIYSSTQQGQGKFFASHFLTLKFQEILPLMSLTVPPLILIVGLTGMSWI